MKHTSIILLTFLSIQLSAQMNRLSEQLGNFKKLEKINGGFSIDATNATVQITSYSATTIRIRASKTKPTNDFSFAIDNLTPSNFLQTINNTDQSLQLSTDSLLINISKNPVRIAIYNKHGQLLSSDEQSLGISWFGNQVSCYKNLHADEKFIGLGEKTGGINRRGNFFQHWNSDVPGYSLNADPLYATIPFFIGIHSKSVYGIFFDNTHKSYFNFGGGADEELFHFGADDGEMNYYFFGGSTVTNIIQEYTKLTGRTPMPALWSLGFQQSRWGYDNQDQLLTIAKTFREKKMPADVIVSDINYMDNYKVFIWSNKFPSVKNMLTNMKQMGFDMVTIIDPGIKVEQGYKAYEEGVANNHFAKYPGGKTYIGHVWPGRCHFPDFTKKATRDWWGNSFKEAYTDNGIKGFWNDMNEPAAWGREFPNLIEFGDGVDKKTLFTVKNAYGLLMAKATYEGTKKLLNGQRPFTLTRAAYSGIQKYAAQWTGDNVSSDEHMLLGFRLLNSMGVSGIPYVGMDIGGFIGNPSPELFIRWLSLGVYSPLFRNHTHFGYNYREPWLFGEINTEKIRKILEQRYQLLPYLYASFYQSHTTGIPVNRMLPIHYTYEEAVYESKFENQFLFGDAILVAPCASTQTVTEVYFPGKTAWYKMNGTTKFEGGSSAFVASPLEDLPVFVKAGSIVPMQSAVQHTKEKGDGILQLHVWQGNDNTTFTYYEDDGETYQYETGAYYLRTINYLPKQQQLLIGEKTGTYASKYQKVKVVLHGWNEVTSTIEADWLNNSFTIQLP
ncbi:MAG: glycoside hydrolase family 31 protein [Chitinophagaceae bacterium]